MRQGQALHDLARDQRLFTASSKARGPTSGQTRGTHINLKCIQSVRTVEDVFTTTPVGRRFVNHKQADKASAEIRVPRARSNHSANEVSTKGTEHPYIWSFLAGLSTPLTQRSSWRASSRRNVRLRDMSRWLASLGGSIGLASVKVCRR